MRNQTVLIEKALSLPTVTGKGHLARLLDMGHPQLNQILKGKRNLTTRQAILLAEVLGKNVLDVVMLCGEDAAKTDAERDWWSRRAPRFVATLAGAVIVAASLTMAPTTRAYSAELVGQAIHYAKYAMAWLGGISSWVGRCRRALLDGLHAQHPRQLTSLARASAFGVL